MKEIDQTGSNRPVLIGLPIEFVELKKFDFLVQIGFKEQEFEIKRNRTNIINT